MHAFHMQSDIIEQGGLDVRANRCCVVIMQRFRFRNGSAQMGSAFGIEVKVKRGGLSGDSTVAAAGFSP